MNNIVKRKSIKRVQIELEEVGWRPGMSELLAEQLKATGDIHGICRMVFTIDIDDGHGHTDHEDVDLTILYNDEYAYALMLNIVKPIGFDEALNLDVVKKILSLPTLDL